MSVRNGNAGTIAGPAGVAAPVLGENDESLGDRVRGGRDRVSWSVASSLRVAALRRPTRRSRASIADAVGELVARGGDDGAGDQEDAHRLVRLRRLAAGTGEHRPGNRVDRFQ